MHKNVIDWLKKRAAFERKAARFRFDHFFCQAMINTTSSPQMTSIMLLTA